MSETKQTRLDRLKKALAEAKDGNQKYHAVYSIDCSALLAVVDALRLALEGK